MKIYKSKNNLTIKINCDTMSYMKFFSYFYIIVIKIARSLESLLNKDFLLHKIILN